MGKYSYGFTQFFGTKCQLEIGSFCSIANKVTIAHPNHPTKEITTHPALYRPKYGFVKNDTFEKIIKNNGKIVISNDVWIGTNVTLLPSIQIGNGAIIAACSVVTKNVPDYAIVGGVPARIITYRFDTLKICQLLESRWWELEDQKIKNLFNK